MCVCIASFLQAKEYGWFSRIFLEQVITVSFANGCVMVGWLLPFLASLSMVLPKYRSTLLVFSYFDDPNLIGTHTHCLLTEQPACRCSITIAAVRCT